ncbi:putative Membrane protein [Corchorus olitorius]|uniref:Membrane protein n=1 Tax=Corchorus olitorius TaxID=93759 RepID=A0A1R3J4C1_9ROSI|nr:putative Membrane protein [Corchorus olitorius]
MEVPVGFLAKLWSFLSFLPFFLLLFLLGLLKAAIISPVVVGYIVIGNSAVVIGLWPAHFLWTYFCVARTKRLGLVLKIALLVSLIVPLVLWPVIAVVGSLLGGIAYGVFAPLIATFQAVGENAVDKCYHCFVDGCLSTIKGSCTVVVDFTDFCFHSYFSYMDELSEKMLSDEKPMDVKLSKLPGSLLVGLIGVLVDVPLITALALWKSPYMLFRGWKRLLEDLIGREGPFLETVCVPFAGLSILLWPLAVIGAVVAAIVASFFLGLYGGVIVHQEDSLCMGLSYIISAVSLFDEYVNDLLYLREGSCLPRPRYRRNMNHSPEIEKVNKSSYDDLKSRGEASFGRKLFSENSRMLKWPIQHYGPIQVWDWLFKSCEVNGRILLREGLISIKDIEECLIKGNCDDVELTRSNMPRDRVFEWFMGPLLIMKEQLKNLQLDENEETCLRKLVICCKNETPEDWNDSNYPSSDNVRKAQLQAIIRRLQGIVSSMSRIPTFRRRFRNLVKLLYIEAIQANASDNHIGGIPKALRYGGKRSSGKADRKDKHETHEVVKNRAYQNEDVV